MQLDETYSNNVFIQLPEIKDLTGFCDLNELMVNLLQTEIDDKNKKLAKYNCFGFKSGNELKNIQE